jgi:lysophospholipase L1-like esterase
MALFFGAMLAASTALAQQPDRWEKVRGGGGKLSEQVSVDFERFVRAVHTRLPETRILYIGIKPSPLRSLQVDRMRLANQVIRTICERDDRLAFLDFDDLMLGWDEKPRRDLYVEDGLHLSPKGYHLWSTVLRPYLVEH